MDRNITDSPPMMKAFSPEHGWKRAIAEWGAHWTGLRYTAITLNSLLITWTLVNLIFIFIKGRSLVSRKYMITVNLMVFIFSITKLLYYAIDPKSINKIMPPLAGNLLNNSSFPALTVGFYMLYVAIRQCTVPNRLLLPVILKTKVIVTFVVICFTISYLTDIIVATGHSMHLMIVVCQFFYIIWGLVFFSLYIALVITYRRAVQKSRKKMEKTCYRKGHCRRDFNKRNLKAIPVCVKLSCVAAIFFLFLSCVNIYLVVIELGFVRNPSMLTKMCNRHRKNWNFYYFNLILMAAEQLMAIALAVAGTQPLKWLRLSSAIISTKREQLTVNSTIESSIYAIDNNIETSFTEDISTTASNSTPLHTSIPCAIDADISKPSLPRSLAITPHSISISMLQTTSHDSVPAQVLSAKSLQSDHIT